MDFVPIVLLPRHFQDFKVSAKMFRTKKVLNVSQKMELNLKTDRAKILLQLSTQQVGDELSYITTFYNFFFNFQVTYIRTHFWIKTVEFKLMVLM